MPSQVDPTVIFVIPSVAAQNNAKSFAGIAVTLQIIALAVFGARVWSRCSPVFRMLMDDYVCIFAYILVVINSSLLLAAVPYGFEQDASTFSILDAQQSFQNFTVARPIWAWAMAAIKCSFALMLLRIEQNIHLRRFLWSIIAIQIILGIYNTAAVHLQCQPYYKAWDLMGAVAGSCWSTQARKTNAVITCVIDIFTDFALALLPLSFLRKMELPRYDRIIVGTLMCLGVIIGVASIMRTLATARFGRTDDDINENIKIAMWSVVEELIALIVICVPYIRSPVEQAMEHRSAINLQVLKRKAADVYQWSSHGSETPSSTAKIIQVRSVSQLTTSSRHDSTIKLEDVQGEQAQRAIYVCPKIVEIWCTKEVIVENDRLSRVQPYDSPSAGSEWMEEPFDLESLNRQKI